MATRYPKRPCGRGGCNEYCAPGFHYCAKHQAEYEAKKKAAAARWLANASAGRAMTDEEKDRARETERRDFTIFTFSRLYTRKWHKVARGFLARHPVCAVCGAPATEVDHIVPHRGDPAVFWDAKNWQPLCHQCHSRKTLKEVSRDKPAAETLIY